MTRFDLLRRARDMRITMTPMNMHDLYNDLAYADHGSKFILNDVLETLGRCATKRFFITQHQVIFTCSEDAVMYKLLRKLTQ